ncbi:amino acid permease [Lactococcus sp.]|uniref:amino acid permease n=1 Tax=Lactococcus sp. TaxID=44273 RepID=UPI0035B2EABF
MENKQNYFISVFQMSVMTIITIAGLRGLPAMAILGWSSIILYLIPALMFFIPSALVAAELGATYEGGIYQWAKEGLGARWGLVAIWMQWIHNVVWYPAQLAFVAAAVASIFGLDQLPNSGLYIAVVIVVVFWWAVWLTLKGGNLFARVASFSGLIGVIIPTLILLFLGVLWLVTKQQVSTTLTKSSFLPNLSHFSSIAIVVANVLAFAGMEVNAVHAKQMKNPKAYTRVVAIAFVSAIIIFVIPTLIIAMVIPQNVNLSNGTVIAFELMFSRFHLGFMGNIMALAIVFGAIASIISWISGPSRGLLNAAQDNALPAYFSKTNPNGAQEGILIIMGIIVSLLASFYVIFPHQSVSMVFSFFIGTAVALYVMMYILMFLAAISLRRKGKTGKQGYRAPALYLMCTFGILSSVAAFILTFIPQSGQTGIPANLYPILVGIVFLLLSTPSLILYQMANKNKK